MGNLIFLGYRLMQDDSIADLIQSRDRFPHGSCHADWIPRHFVHFCSGLLRVSLPIQGMTVL